MKKDIHPELHEITAHCACGAAFKTRSTANDIHMTLCSHCHPFYTGDQKFVDTAGRIEKFQKKYANAGKKTKKAK
jgi:large subunit ribosomal protein L31